MTVVDGAPDSAFVKGGLFAKSGVELPPAVVEQFWRNAEKWEKPVEGAQVAEANWSPTQ